EEVSVPSHTHLAAVVAIDVTRHLGRVVFPRVRHKILAWTVNPVGKPFPIAEPGGEKTPDHLEACARERKAEHVIHAECLKLCGEIGEELPAHEVNRRAAEPLRLLHTMEAHTE